MLEAFPAVIVAPGSSAGAEGRLEALSFASSNRDGPSSSATTVVLPREVTSTGTISSRKVPSAIALRARVKLRTAKSSCSRRVMLKADAQASPQVPIGFWW